MRDSVPIASRMHSVRSHCASRCSGEGRHEVRKHVVECEAHQAGALAEELNMLGLCVTVVIG
jgi:hypothetical protein